MLRPTVDEPKSPSESKQPYMYLQMNPISDLPQLLVLSEARERSILSLAALEVDWNARRTHLDQRLRIHTVR